MALSLRSAQFKILSAEQRIVVVCARCVILLYSRKMGAEDQLEDESPIPGMTKNQSKKRGFSILILMFAAFIFNLETSIITPTAPFYVLLVCRNRVPIVTLGSCLTFGTKILGSLYRCMVGW